MNTSTYRLFACLCWLFLCVNLAQGQSTGADSSSRKQRLSFFAGLSVPIATYNRDSEFGTSFSDYRNMEPFSAYAMNYQRYLTKHMGIAVELGRVSHKSQHIGSAKKGNSGQLAFGEGTFSSQIPIEDISTTYYERRENFTIPHDLGSIYWNSTERYSYNNLSIGPVFTLSKAIPRTKQAFEMAFSPFLGLSFAEIPDLVLSYDYASGPYRSLTQSRFFPEQSRISRFALIYGGSVDVVHKIDKVLIGLRGSITSTANRLKVFHLYENEQVYLRDRRELIDNTIEYRDSFIPSYVNLFLLLAVDIK